MSGTRTDWKCVADPLSLVVRGGQHRDERRDLFVISHLEGSLRFEEGPVLVSERPAGDSSIVSPERARYAVPSELRRSIAAAQHQFAPQRLVIPETNDAVRHPAGVHRVEDQSQHLQPVP